MQFPDGGDRRVDRRDLVALGDALYEAEGWRLIYDRARTSPWWRAVRTARQLPRRARRALQRPPTPAPPTSVTAPRSAGPPAVLVVDREQPLWDRRAGALRTATLLHAFRAAGARVTLGYLDPRRHEPYTSELEQAGIGVIVGADRLRAFVAGQGPNLDLVCLTWPDVADPLLAEVRRTCPGALLVYDAIDLHHLRFARQEAHTGRPAGAAAEREREARIVRGVDLVLTVSDAEAEVLRREFGVADARTVPLLEAQRTTPVPGFAGRHGIVFVGSYDHRPNLDGALWLIDDVLPLVRQRADIAVTLAGQLPPPELLSRAGPGVRVTGWLPDVVELLDGARVAVCPLLWGAGVKGKNVLALGNGVPLVTTAVGAEGMDLVDGVHALVRDEAHAFADAVLEVHESPELWALMSAAGLDYVHRRHSPEAVQAVVTRLVAEAQSRRG